MKKSNRFITAIRDVSSAKRIPIIAEVKNYSPVAGSLAANRSVVDMVKAYEAGGAACVSIVTGKWFHGQPSMLQEAASTTKLPLLRKDFIINKDQIILSKQLGADAVLLTKKLLTTPLINTLIEVCLKHDINPFIEVEHAKELNNIPANDQIIIALANRDISQKEMDVDSGFRSIEHIQDISEHYGAIVSASGISCANQSNLLYRVGFDALLIGTELMKARCSKTSLEALSKISSTPFDKS